MDTTQFSALVALWVGGLALFVFLFQRLERRVDGLETEMRNLRRDLAEEFRAQRAEVSAQTTALANAIIAARGQG